MNLKQTNIHPTQPKYQSLYLKKIQTQTSIESLYNNKKNYQFNNLARNKNNQTTYHNDYHTH